MGYKKLVQYGNITELYEYDKQYKKPNHHKIQSAYHRKRAKDIRERLIQYGNYEQSKSSKNRTLKNFFRLCHHNNVESDSIHFVTLTFTYDLSPQEAFTYLRRFMEKVQKAQPTIPVRYISVPEYTKENRLHLHLLVYDLSSRVSGQAVWSSKKQRYTHTTERDTRLLQNLFTRGYLDICPATYTSRKIAGYMAKYMAKTFSDRRFATKRNYNCSRNIKKVRSHGSNTFDTKFLKHNFIHTTDLLESDVKLYNVPYMGDCLKTTIVKIIK